MIAVAFSIDLLNVSLDITGGFLSPVIDGLEWLFFGIWLKSYGVGLLRQSPGLTLTAFVVDFWIGNILFPWTWRIGYAVFVDQFHEEEGV